MSHAPFDVALKRAQRARPAGADFLLRRAAEDVAERLAGINRPYRRILALGGGPALAQALAAEPALAGRVSEIFMADLSVSRVAAPLGLAADPERLPFREGAFDLVVSLLGLGWANDLPGALVQIRHALAPDGLFIGVVFGPRTLQEVRAALIAAEEGIRGGAGPRVAPFPDLQDLAGLLSRAGFALPVADRDMATVTYSNPMRLFADLRAMGETAALADRPQRPLTRAILAQALAHLAASSGDEAGRLRVQFEVLAFTGWRPHESQQKPLRPGAARARLADALGVREESAGEKAGG